MTTQRKIIAVLMLVSVVCVPVFNLLMVEWLQWKEQQVARTAAGRTGRLVLSEAYNEFIQNGMVASKQGPWQLFVFTNSTIVINGSSYPSCVATKLPGFTDDGVLVMTAGSGLIIWLDAKTGAKAIPPSGYEARFFPPGF